MSCTDAKSQDDNESHFGSETHADSSGEDSPQYSNSELHSKDDSEHIMSAGEESNPQEIHVGKKDVYMCVHAHPFRTRARTHAAKSVFRMRTAVV